MAFNKNGVFQNIDRLVPQQCRLFVHLHNSELQHFGMIVVGVFIGWLIVAWWRGQRDALKAQGWGGPDGTVWAFRWRSDLFLYSFSRHLTAQELMRYATFFEHKFGLIPHSIRERTWPRYFFLKSFMRIYQEHFPKFVSFASLAKYMSSESLCLGIDGFGAPLIARSSAIGMITIGGKSGLGKSTLAHMISMQYDSRLVRVVGGKRGSYPKAKWVGVKSDLDSAKALQDFLKEIVDEIEYRYQVCADHGVDSVSRLPSAIKKTFPRILTVFEEADSFLRLSSYTKETRSIGENIIAMSRFIIKQNRGANSLVLLLSQTLQKFELDINAREGGIVISAETDTIELSFSLFNSDVAFSKSLRNGKFVIWDENGIRRFLAITPNHLLPGNET
jgi:hypothetical protein